MSEILQIIQLVFSFLIVPVLTYIVKLEKRITKIETIITMYERSWDGRERRGR